MGGVNQVLGDYAGLLRAFLPHVRGFHCCGPDGNGIWSDEPDPPVRLSSAYKSALSAIQSPGGADAIRVELDSAVAYLIALRNEKGQPLGVLTMLMATEAATFTAEACAERVLPATRTLERELSLRVRLLEGYRKLSVQAAEERLLHEVERAVQGPPDCQVMLNRILSLCRHYLQVQSAALLIPNKNVAIVQGTKFSRVELEMLLENQSEANDTGDGDLYSAPIRSADRAVIGVVALAGWNGPDFSARRRARVGRYLVTHIGTVLERAYDSLTGLTAWPAFEKLMHASVAACAGAPPTLMYLDLDRLQLANDTLGREGGDQVLAGFAAILRDELAGHAIARVVSDHFAALLTETDLEAAREIGERIAARFRRLEFGHGERSFRASVSIGIAPAAEDGDTIAEGGGPLATAQVACAAAKDRGRGRVEVYQPEDVSIIQRFDDIQLVGCIRNAIDRGRLALLGQPIIPVKPTGPVNHGYFEVLVRLLDEDDSHISPSEFLSAAERYQLMEELDRWVVSKTLELLATNPSGLKASGTRFAINLSGQSLGSEPFLTYVQQQLERTRVPPELICFEITETVAVANLQRAQAFMHALRKIGCRFSLDDFGTGLSSFAYLKLFPVDTLKIDGSFIRDLPTNVVSQSVVAAISEVARVMQLETVAEFVQDNATLDLLSKLGITWAQGYLLGEPTLLNVHISGMQVGPQIDSPHRSAGKRGR
ncbi:MAG: bifunctional diguanylate cyclase/phosphodiesterase [Gammaproteobacteria bacterium]|nr:bifunctional diguanylate cyclase/phosphodiesterase [Gammaproteobacteria bacterium]